MSILIDPAQRRLHPRADDIAIAALACRILLGIGGAIVLLIALWGLA